MKKEKEGEKAAKIQIGRQTGTDRYTESAGEGEGRDQRGQGTHFPEVFEMEEVNSSQAEKERKKRSGERQVMTGKKCWEMTMK